LLTRPVHEDPEDQADSRIAELENENAALQRKLEALERELQCRSPSKKQKVGRLDAFDKAMDGKENTAGVLLLKEFDLNAAAAPVGKSPRKGMRSLTARNQWAEEPALGSP
jgi:hypothetical protein